MFIKAAVCMAHRLPSDDSIGLVNSNDLAWISMPRNPSPAQSQNRRARDFVGTQRAGLNEAIGGGAIRWPEVRGCLTVAIYHIGI